jgi:hypothetical protein
MVITCIYFQPERINPDRDMKGYDIRSDIWSLGITMVRIRKALCRQPS